MSFAPTINLLKGFCDLPFGCTPETAVSRFGDPEETQDLKDEILMTSTLVYHYWEEGFSLFFDLNRNRRLISVELDNRDAVLFDVTIFSLKEKELIILMKENGFSMTDSEVHNWGEKRISFDNGGLDCYYENNRLVSVNFGVADLPGEFGFSQN